MSDIGIIRNVPLPKPAGSERTTKYPFASMEVDEMFFLPERTTDKFATYAGLWGRKLGRKFSTRTLTMRLTNTGWIECEPTEEGAKTGVGVWRTA